MERSRKFIKDIFIYAIGNLGSKLITFLLVPLYTYFIAPDDFGYYDIALNISFLGIGVLSFQLRDGVFRFLLDNEDDRIRKDIISFTCMMWSIFVTLPSLSTSFVAGSPAVKITISPFLTSFSRTTI